MRHLSTTAEEGGRQDYGIHRANHGQYRMKSDSLPKSGPYRWIRRSGVPWGQGTRRAGWFLFGGQKLYRPFIYLFVI